jgi:hypothetical protein
MFNACFSRTPPFTSSIAFKAMIVGSIAAVAGAALSNLNVSGTYALASFSVSIILCGVAGLVALVAGIYLFSNSNSNDKKNIIKIQEQPQTPSLPISIQEQETKGTSRLTSLKVDKEQVTASSDKIQIETIDWGNLPSYFIELKKSGFDHLIEHLVQMRSFKTHHERRELVQKMTFSQFSHVVLETREAIIQKIENSIPPGHNKILFLLGVTGAGKSTTLCYLRGDKMKLEDYRYVSQNDTEECIGHNLSNSCTFLPKVEIVDDLAIVDFPGFKDTHAQAICLGLECALKTLIKKYQPNILIIESITNMEGGYAAVSELGASLSRLLGNGKKQCILGLTKYSKDSNYNKIRTIEEQQRKEILENDVITKAICEQKVYSEFLDNDNLSNEKKQKILKLKNDKDSEIKELKEKQTEQLKLQKTQFDRIYRELEEKGKTFLTQIGLEKFISFDDLEDSNSRSLCLVYASEPLREKYEVSQSLDFDAKSRLDHLFKNLLQCIATTKEWKSEFKNIEAFMQSVLETSLINTVFKQVNPEIGKLLHLSEIDPEIVKNYDNKLLDETLNKYMKAVISFLDISVIKINLKRLERKISEEKMAIVNKNLNQVCSLILGLEGIRGKTLENSWNSLHQNEKGTQSENITGLVLAPWASCFLDLPQVSKNGISILLQPKLSDQIEQSSVEKAIDTCINELHHISLSITRLLDLQTRFTKVITGFNPHL